MKKILIVAQFTQLPGEDGNNRSRFKLISEMLVKEGYEVTVITSRFRELDRTYRKDNELYNSAPYNIVLLEEVGYSKNIGFKRIYSMWSFANSLKVFLNNTKEVYDLVYACVPGLDSALVAGRFAHNNSIPFIIDVQDVWPEVMYDLVLDVPIISNILFSPIQIMANKVYAMADGILAVSKTYLEIAKKKNKKSLFNEYVYIGTNLEEYNINESTKKIEIDKNEEEFWIAYIGSLGHSYDINTFIKGAQIARDNGINVRPIIIGSGPLERDFRTFAENVESNAIFTGWVDYSTMKSYLAKSDVVINAIKRKAPQSITNKIGDYLSSGKPILNGSLNREFLELIEKHDFGVNYDPENPQSLANSIEKIYRIGQLQREQMGGNARKLAEEQFDRKNTYIKIIDLINQLLEKWD